MTMSRQRESLLTTPAKWLVLVFVVALVVGGAAGLPTQPNASARFVIQQGEKCGYIDRLGNAVIPPKFASCEDFSENLAPVKIEGKWGFIDTNGAVTIRPQFDECRWSFSEGLAAVRLGELWGYIDATGQFVIPPKFEYAQGFSAGRGIVLVEGGKHGIIDKTGVLIVLPFDNSSWEFTEGLLAVENDGKWGFVDLSGDVTIPLQFHQANAFSERLASVEFSEGKKQWGFIDRSGKTVIAPSFDDAGSFGEGLAPVSVGFKYGYINSSGQIVIQPTFEMASSFTDDLATVIGKGHKYGFIDHSGKFVISPQYDQAFMFVEGLAPVSYNNCPESGESYFDAPEGAKLPSCDWAFGYVDKSGKTVWEPPEFKKLEAEREANKCKSALR